MALESLLELVETLRERIDEHGAALRQSEALTRAALIDPLLRELGWDTSDPALVIPEYRSAAGSADYALVSGGMPPAMIIEAKKLGEPLDDKVALQSLNYCNLVGTPHFALTDGNAWKIYATFEQAPLADRLVAEFRIRDMHAAEVCLKALALWYPSVVAGSVSAGQAPIIEPQQEARAPRQPEETGQVYSPPIAAQTAPTQIAEPPSASEFLRMFRTQQEQASAAQAASTISESANDYGDGEWIALSELSVSPGDSPPLETQFPDGSRVHISKWKDIVVESVHWLTSKNYLNENHCPIQRGKRFLLAESPVHPNDKPFKASATIGSLYIETNYSARDCVRNTIAIINRTGQDPAQFKVRVAHQPAAQRISETAPAAPTTFGMPDTDGDNWVALSDLNMRRGDARPQLTAIQFPDGRRSHITRWTHITVEVVRWLIDNNHLSRDHCPVQRASRYIIADSPIHPNGNGFTRTVSVGGIFIEMNYQPQDFIRNAITIIQHTGQDIAQFRLSLRD